MPKTDTETYSLNTLEKLSERFLQYDEIEKDGGSVQVNWSDNASDKLEIKVLTFPSNSESKKYKSIPQSLIIPLNDIEKSKSVVDEYIEDAIDRMSKVKKSSESIQTKSKVSVKNENTPSITKKGGGRDYSLTADYIYHYDETHNITALKGFITDLSSIPWYLWFILPPDSLTLTAPVMHDLLYRSGGVLPIPQVNAYRTFTRSEADNLFLRIMQEEGISKWRCWAGFQAVHRFGESSWQSK